MTRNARVEWRLPRLSGPQRELLHWQPPGAWGTCGALSASWGSGKSLAAAVKFVFEAMSIAPWDGHGEQPLAAVIAPTHHSLAANLLPMLEAVFPPGIVTTKRVSPLRYWVLRNGVKVIFLSGDGLVDSFSARIVWVDECTAPVFLDRWRWSRIVSRLRGRGSKRLIVSGIASNLPVVRERFDKPDDPTFGIVMPGLLDNPAVTEEQRDQLLALVPAANREACLHGGWLPTSENIYDVRPEWHSSEYTGDKSQPVHLGVDPGNKSVALVAQFHDGQLVIVDEVVGAKQDAEELCREVHNRGWRTIETVQIDAQASLDTVTQIRKVLPDALVQQPPKQSQSWSVEHGIERVQWALRDAAGATRLTFSHRLWDYPVHPERGLIRSVTSYRRTPRGKPYRDDVVDHQVDALRYLAVALIQPEDTRPAPEPIKPFRMF